MSASISSGERGVLSAEERRRVRRAADRVASLREVTRRQRTCVAFIESPRSRADGEIEAVAVALASCWSTELERRRREIDAEARLVAWREAHGSMGNSFWTSGGGRPLWGRL